MLVLTRKPGERIMIGEDISVVVVAVEGSRVRIGLEAPLEVPIHRQEIIGRLPKMDQAKNEPELAAR